MHHNQNLNSSNKLTSLDIVRWVGKQDKMLGDHVVNIWPTFDFQRSLCNISGAFETI